MESHNKRRTGANKAGLFDRKHAEATRIIVVRHGETDWNVIHRLQGVTDTNLTETGHKQAERVAERLSKDPTISRIYSSNLTRAIKTAKEIVKARRGEEKVEPIAIDERLREFDLGIFAGHTHAEARQKFRAEWDEHQTNDDYVIPNGESYSMFIDRTKQALMDIHRSHEGATICIVTHGGVIDCIRQFVITEDLCTVSRCGNASISEIIVSEGKWSLIKWNDVSHLAKLHRPVLLADDVLHSDTSDEEEC